MPDENEVKIRITTEGTKQASSAIGELLTTLTQFRGAITDLNQGLELAKKALHALEEPFKIISGVADEAVESFKHFRSMAATMGGTIADAELMSNTFALAGLSTEKLTFAMFRLSMAIQQGGKELSHIGVDFKDSGGHIKATGEVFEEVRDRLSKLTNSTERAAEAAKLFGARQARELMPVLGMTAEEYTRLKTKAEENSAMNQEFEESAKGLIESHAELAEKMKKVSIEMAVMYAIPIVKLFEDWVAVPIVSYLDNVIGRLKAMTQIAAEGAQGEGGLKGFFKALLAGVGISAADADEYRKIMDNLEKWNAKVKKMKEEREAPASYTEQDRKVELEKARFAYQMQVEALKNDERIAGERSRLQTGSDVEALESRRRLNQQLLQLAEEEAEKERRIQLKGRVALAPEEELKIVEKLEKQKEKIREDEAKLALEIEKARVKDVIKLQETEIAQRKALSQQYIAVLATEREQDLAAVRTFGLNKAVQIEVEFKIAEKFALDTKAARLNAIDSEMAAKNRELAAVKGFADEERKIQKELDDLQTERVKAGADADREIAQSRQRLMDKIKALAAEEASIGESLEQKAIASLQARGRKRVSQADIAQERARLSTEARETFAGLATGGTVDISKIAASREYGKQLEQMRAAGTTPGGAAGMFQAQQAAAFGGREFNAIPTGMQQWAPQLQALATQMKQSADAAVERLTGTLQDTFNYFVDSLIRKLEFEAART